MKKKILSLILVLMLLPIASLFSACGKKDGYNLNNLSADFSAIDKENNNINFVDGNVEFDYSSHAHLYEIFNGLAPYKSMHTYNDLTNNILSFACEYVHACSNNDLTDNAALKNEVKTNLDNLKSAFSRVNENINVFAEIIHISYPDNLNADACLLRYENLLIAYEDLFNKSISFNNSLQDLYFNNILKDGNPNVASVSVENFDVNTVVSKLRSRIKYQISNLSQSYVEMEIDGKEFSKKVVSGEIVIDLTGTDYQNNVNALKDALAAEKAGNVTNKDLFYDLAVKAYNIQATLNNDKGKFVLACNSIAYSNVIGDVKASAFEKMCADIIESNRDIIYYYNSVLTGMLAVVA